MSNGEGRVVFRSEIGNSFRFVPRISRRISEFPVTAPKAEAGGKGQLLLVAAMRRHSRWCITLVRPPEFGAMRTDGLIKSMFQPVVRDSHQCDDAGRYRLPSHLPVS